MDLIKAQNHLKNFSDEQLAERMKSPGMDIPQYLVMSELQRRATLRAEANAQPQPNTSILEEMNAGLGSMAQSGPPQVQGYQSGGPVLWDQLSRPDYNYVGIPGFSMRGGVQDAFGQMYDALPASVPREVGETLQAIEMDKARQRAQAPYMDALDILDAAPSAGGPDMGPRTPMPPMESFPPARLDRPGRPGMSDRPGSLVEAVEGPPEVPDYGPYVSPMAELYGQPDPMNQGAIEMAESYPVDIHGLPMGPAVDIHSPDAGMYYVPGVEDAEIIETPDAPDMEREGGSPDAVSSPGSGVGRSTSMDHDMALKRGSTPEGLGELDRIMSEFDQMMAGFEEQGEQDKWLALAQMGFGIAGGESPYFATNVGQGGAAGMQNLAKLNEQQRRQQMRGMGVKADLTLAKDAMRQGHEDLAIKRATLALQERMGGQGGDTALDYMEEYRNGIEAEIGTLEKALYGGWDQATGSYIIGEEDAKKREAMEAQLYQLFNELRSLRKAKSTGTPFNVPGSARRGTIVPSNEEGVDAEYRGS